MITALIAAAIAAQVPSAGVGYEQLVAGQNEAAISVIGERGAATRDPARLINLGTAHARNGDVEEARRMFVRAYYSRDWVELETATGAWVDSRTLARQALAMLDRGEFVRTSQFARK